MPENPFGVKNPEDQSPEYIAQNFVDMFTDFAKVREPENSFVHGARGTGKSMMMRSLETAVMLCQEENRNLSELKHLGVHVPLRRVDFSIPELDLLKGAAKVALGEHMLIMHVALRLANSLVGVLDPTKADQTRELAGKFVDLFSACGGKPDGKPGLDASPDDYLHWIAQTCERDAIATRQFVKRALFGGEQPYSGALCGFLDFLLPFVDRLVDLRCMPQPPVPVYVMLDDADNLPIGMQRILNSWVSVRAVRRVCLKITTQLGYATYRTTDGRLIESPHDFNVIDIGSLYTNVRDRFSERVSQIVQRRLKLADINSPPTLFFPRDEEQQKRLAEIEAAIVHDWEARSILDPRAREGASRPRDEVLRYAVPRLMRELSGASRSSHTFSYAGFDSLVDLSSGVVRWFLEPAARMYDELASELGSDSIAAIPPSVQDREIYQWSKEFAESLQGDPVNDPDDKENLLTKDASLHAVGHEGHIAKRLYNLVNALGRFFRARLLDPEASEQRAFSVVVRGKISPELDEVLGYGVRSGYLQRSDNAAKEAYAGRRPRYILARRLGPYFKLDISGYAAHLSVTAEALGMAMLDPDKFVALKTKDNLDVAQLSLPIADDDPEPDSNA